MLKPLRLIPSDTKIDFLGKRIHALVLSTAMNIAAIVLLFTVGLNLGVDFKGGVVVEVKTPGPANLAALRSSMDSLGLGELSLQQFGQPDVVLIRVPRQEAGDACFKAAVANVGKTMGQGYVLRDSKLTADSATLDVKTPAAVEGDALVKLAAGMSLSQRDVQAVDGGVQAKMTRSQADEWCQQVAIRVVELALGKTYEIRRTESVGPKVGDELIRTGIIAVVVTMAAIVIYVWVRFEWQFAIGGLIALLHDVMTTIGLFCLTQIEFNLASLAAVLTIAGYSINDTVVVFDRVRENMRRYKKMPLADLLNLSVNETLSRTIMTAGTTFLAVLALVLLGGPVIEGFSVSMLWGAVVGTYSSIWIACAILVYTRLRPEKVAEEKEDAADAAAVPQAKTPKGGPAAGPAA